MRDSTERPELLENNSLILAGTSTDEILNAFKVAKDMSI
jgi:UDP-N-acetylglucosamine 2-epimerase